MMFHTKSRIATSGYNRAIGFRRRILFRIYFILLVCAISLPVNIASADEFSQLKVQGQFRERDFTREDLLEMKQVEIKTGTIWTTGVHTYMGPSLFTVLKNAGLSKGVIRLTALNNYSTVLDITDLDANYPILAVTMDGQYMSVRDKGPYWIIYPYDDYTRYQTEAVYAQSIWQLTRISLETEE